MWLLFQITIDLFWYMWHLFQITIDLFWYMWLLFQITIDLFWYMWHLFQMYVYTMVRSTHKVRLGMMAVPIIVSVLTPLLDITSVLKSKFNRSLMWLFFPFNCLMTLDYLNQHYWIEWWEKQLWSSWYFMLCNVVFCLSSPCALCAQCCQYLWIVHSW